MGDGMSYSHRGVPDAIDRDGQRYCGGCGYEIGLGWWCCWPCFGKQNPTMTNSTKVCSLCNTLDSELDEAGRYCPSCVIKTREVTPEEVTAALSDLRAWTT
jgi:hypothetical protein